MKDYHVHYHIDACASDEMTFENIDSFCKELGLDEIAVLKHYSENMPNGGDHWICWHKIVKPEWEQYLKEFKAYKPENIVMRSGVETELCNESGDINIPESEQAKIDMAALSVHYMIDLDILKMDLMLYPNLNFCPSFNNDEGKKTVEEWRQKTIAAGEENIVAGLVNGYMNAIKRYPKVKTLAHMSDGLLPLRTYLVDIEKVGENRCVEIFEPLMKLMSEKNVLWELNGDHAPYIKILKRANEIGVKFCATADGHFLRDGWGPMIHHQMSEDFIDKHGFNRGIIEF